MIYIYIVYAIPFFILGGVMSLLAASSVRVFDPVPLAALAAFGFLHGIFELVHLAQVLEMAGLPVTSPAAVDYGSLFFLATSFVGIMIFGVELLIRESHRTNKFRFLYALVPLLFALIAIIQLRSSTDDWVLVVESAARNTLGLISCFLAALAMWAVAGRGGNHQRSKFILLMRIAAILFLAYGLSNAIFMGRLPRNPVFPEHHIQFHPYFVVARMLVMMCLTWILSHCFLEEISRVQSSLQSLHEEVATLLAHDMRNMINNIQSSAELLLDEPRDLDQQAQSQFLEILMRNIKSLGRLVSDMFDINLIDLKRLKLECKSIDIAQVVEEACHTIQPNIINHKIEKRLPRCPVLVNADRTRLDQILSNLLGNAGKYSLPDTEIIVEVKPNTHMVSVQVTSKGTQLSDEDRMQIFDRYFRASSAQVATKGSGLGLAIVKGLVESHGGSTFVSSSPNGENTFGFWLPAHGTAE